MVIQLYGIQPYKNQYFIDEEQKLVICFANNIISIDISNPKE